MNYPVFYGARTTRLLTQTELGDEPARPSSMNFGQAPLPKKGTAASVKVGSSATRVNRMEKAGIYYSDYLRLKELLDAQHPESAKHGAPAHDEMLFIITHQAYELWFKEILHELRSILELFSHSPLDANRLGMIVARLERILAIQKVIHRQIEILETMTPLDFLDFRDYLTPASGFQSVQFREIELRLGLALIVKPAFFVRFREEDREYLQRVMKEPTLLERLNAWLERTPFLEFGEFRFWERYQEAVERMLAEDERTIQRNPLLTEAERAHQIEELAATRASFANLFDPTLYRRHQSAGRFHLSHGATLSALFISLYRDEPILQKPFSLLTRLIELDEQLTAWRSSHALMAQRMLGGKIGTGGSSGHAYLQSTIVRNRIFVDLFNLSTFLIPRSALPELPQPLKKCLGFYAPGFEEG